MSEDVFSWDRRPGEPTLWFSRFEAYRKLGPKRTLLRAYKEVMGRPTATRTGGTWKVRSEQWEWKKRAAAWDDAETQRDREEEAEARKADKAQRIKILQAYRGKATQAMALLNPAYASWGNVTAALQMIFEQLRAEFGEDSVETPVMNINLHWPDSPAEAQRKAEELEKRADEARRE